MSFIKPVEMTMNDDDRAANANRNPLTRETGARPVNTGIGVVVAGAAARAVAEPEAAPVGTVVGGRAEMVAAEPIDPTRERAYWRNNFTGRDYVEKGSSFDDYGPAFGFGVSARGRYPGRDFDDVEPEMSSDWAATRGASTLSWDRAKHAARDAWNRISASS